MTGRPLSRILYAEDEPDIREIATMVLETIGEYTVKPCASGEEAFAAAPLFKPDLFLFDVMMPGMDGPGTLKALRGIAEFEKTPVIFITAKVMEEEIERYQEMGAAGVVKKPFDPENLCAQIGEIWQQRNS